MDFLIKLNEQVSGPARKSADSLSKLESQIKSETATLSKLEAQMRAVQKAGVVDIGIYRQLSGAIDNQKNKVAGLTGEMIRSGGAGFKPAAAEASGFARSLGAIGTAGAAAVVGVLAVGGAIGWLGSKLVQMGVQASEAKGDITRSLELTYGSQEAAEHTYKVIENITGRIAISQERAMQLSDTLIKAGQVNGDQMVASIEAVGKAEAARKGAGQVIEGIITRSQKSRFFSVSREELMSVGLSYREMAQAIAKQTGRGVAEAEIQLRTGGVRLKAGLDALNQVVDQRMGKLANEKFMTVGAQTDRLRDGFRRLFESFDTGPMARGLAVIANLLDENTVSGSALRAVLKGAFDGISRAVEVVSPYVETFFKGMILLSLKAYNALYPVRQAIARMFGGGDEGVAKFENTMITVAERVGEGFRVAAVALAWMIDNSSALVKALEFMPGIGSAITGMKMLLPDVDTEKPRKDGKAVADGVAQGIREGTPAVVSAMQAMGKAGVSGFDAQMQIRSPSRVMHKRGGDIDEGLAGGVRDNAAKPAAAMAGVAPGIVGAAQGPRGSAPQGRGAGGGVQVVFQAGAIVVQGAPQDLLDNLAVKLTEMMADTFQQAALLQGTG